MQQALKMNGWETERRQASWMLRVPTKLFTLLAGVEIEHLVADRLTTLRSPRLEVLLHPSDLVLSGKEADVARARAVIAEQLAFSKAYMTWTKEANELEDRLRVLWRRLKERSRGFSAAEALTQLHAIERDLRAVKLPYEEWEVLFRNKLLLERGLLQVAAGITDRLEEPADTCIEQREAALEPSTAFTMPLLLPAMAALCALAILAWQWLRARSQARAASGWGPAGVRWTRGAVSGLRLRIERRYLPRHAMLSR
jgi:hypothetical protein